MTNNTDLSCTKDLPLSPSTAQVYYFCLAGVCSVIAIFAITLNTIFLVTVLHKKSLWTLSNQLLTLLALIDLIQGLSICPLTLYVAVRLTRVKPACWLMKLLPFLGHSLEFASLSVIFIIAIEQYIAILHPYFHAESVTTGRLIYPATGLNVVVLVISGLARFKVQMCWIICKSLRATIKAILLILIIYMYIMISHTAGKTARKITETNLGEGRRIVCRARAMKTSLIVLLSAIICHCPIMAYNVYEHLDNDATLSYKTYAMLSTHTIGTLNSVLDPLVYFWRMKSLRKAMGETLFLNCKISSETTDRPSRNPDTVTANRRLNSRAQTMFESKPSVELSNVRRRTSVVIRQRSTSFRKISSARKISAVNCSFDN